MFKKQQTNKKKKIFKKFVHVVYGGHGRAHIPELKKKKRHGRLETNSPLLSEKKKMSEERIRSLNNRLTIVLAVALVACAGALVFGLHLQSRCNDLQNSLDSVRADLTDRTAKITALQNTADKLTTDVSNLKTTTTNLTNTVAALNTKTTANTSATTTLNEKVQTIQKSLY